ncbi:hypothetical protein HRF87_25110 [Bacillus sp. CRN 9]|nr:hypothetical protein [Bacillus sp. CRN 9]
MYLYKGITGTVLHNEKMPAEIDDKQFKSIIYAVIISDGGRVKQIQKASYPRNFHCALVEWEGSDFYIFLNKFCPLLACATSYTMQGIHFIDCPVLQLFRPYYTVLALEYLNRPVIINHKRGGKIVINADHNLSEIELENINYWKPGRLGEIIYNEWD